jgi:hypothetical protein
MGLMVTGFKHLDGPILNGRKLLQNYMQQSPADISLQTAVFIALHALDATNINNFDDWFRKYSYVLLQNQLHDEVNIKFLRKNEFGNLYSEYDKK